ncbi:MAG: YgjV family protein [Clostridia bacterium]|nr:YgjV family protein [Clostridia bacterium]MBQ4298582.1 YgjV family protein [Clostridia bacterium]
MDFLHDVLPHIFGGVSALLNIFSYQFKDMRRLLFLQIASSLLLIGQFFFLGAAAGALTNLAGILMRIAVYLRAKKGLLPGEKEGRSALLSPWAWGFASLFLLVAVFTYRGPLTLLSPLSMVFFTFSVWHADPVVMRRVNFFLCAPMWIAYNIYTHAWMGLITDAMLMISILVSFFRFFRRSRRTPVPPAS